MSPRLATAALAASLLIGACAPREPHREPPLRPLLYTEGHGGIGEGLPALWEWTTPGYDPVAFPSEHDTHVARPTEGVAGPAAMPEDLMLGVYQALAHGDAAALEPFLFDAEDLAASAHMGSETAEAELASMRDELSTLMAQMSPGASSRAREDGLASLLTPGQFVVGRPRNVDGSVCDDDEQPVMHWGNELQLLLDGGSSFVLRYPRLLRGADGMWRLAQAPTIDGRFDTWIQLGLALKPEMMNSEHASFPISVGNYWHYRTRQPTVEATEGEGYGVLTNEGYRDEIIDVTDYPGYRIARVRRLFDNPSRTSESFAWLATPTRLFDCNRDCVRHGDDIDWLMTWAQRQVPVLVFPAHEGVAWGAGGTDGRNNVFRTQPDRAGVDVPAGVFDDAFEITRNTARGRQSTFFVPGIGVVMRREVSSFETDIEELMNYRVMP